MSEQTLLPQELRTGMYLKKHKTFVREVHPDADLYGPSPEGKSDGFTVYTTGNAVHTSGVGEKLEVETDTEVAVEGDTSKLPISGAQVFPSLGSDPEFFVTTRDGRLLPAFLFLPSKDAKSNGLAAPFWDGFQAEVIFDDATECADMFTGWLRTGRQNLLRDARAFKTEARISNDAVVEVPLKLLESALPEHVAFGCVPSKNAYLAKGRRIHDPRQVPIRFAGGHLHFGWPMGRPTAPRATAKAYVKALDRTVGLLSVVLSPSPLEAVRREYYGLAGEYRDTRYGFEYRTLSNFWLRAAPLAHLILDVARFGLALEVMNWTSLLKISDAEVQEAINTNNVPMAQTLLGRALRLWENWYKHRYCVKSDQFVRLLDNGLKDYEAFLSGSEAHRWTVSMIKRRWRALIKVL